MDVQLVDHRSPNVGQAVDSPAGGGLGGIVCCVESIADGAGAEILRAGGNATDAALATAFAQGVVNPIYCGIGGGFHGLFHDGAKGISSVVVAPGAAPRGARPDMWRVTGRWGARWTVEHDRNQLGYQASMIPGFVRGAHEAYRRFGSGAISWQEIIQPAIRLASDGFLVYPYLYRLWMPPGPSGSRFLETGDGPTTLSVTKEARRVYLRSGRTYEIGERLQQPDYAATLERIALNGPDEFYEGETAHRIAKDFALHGGLITLDDLRQYQPEVAPPLTSTFRDLTVLTEPPPALGIVTCEILNVLEGYDLAEFGFNTPRYLDKLAKSMYAGFRDRMRYVADPRFTTVPVERLISKEYAARLRDSLEHATPSSRRRPQRVVPAETTHVSVIDRAGNAAGITHSIGMSSGVVTPGLGFLHNCLMIMFDPEPGHLNSIAPLKRPLDGGGPVLFMRGDQPWLLIGSPAGARKVTALIQATLNILDFGMTPGDAVSADRIHVEDEENTIVVEPNFPPATLLGLAELGYHVRFESYTARLCAVEKEPTTGALRGGSDPRGGRGLAVV